MAIFDPNRPGRRTAALIASLVATIALLSGCGGSRTPSPVVVAVSAAPDALDPALASSQSAATILSTVYTPLLTYRHQEGPRGAQLIPGLAERLPRISDEGRRYELRLRADLRYSDGTVVRASDFERTIARVLLMDSPGSNLFLGIRGAKRYRRTRVGRIAGITTSDATRRITVELVKPDATFANRLATVYAGLVPGQTPPRNRSAHPPPGVGQFVLSATIPGHELRLTVNRRMPAIAGDPPARTRHIIVRVVPRQQVQIQRLLRDQIDLLLDPPTAQGLALARREVPHRLRSFATLSSYFLFFNPNVEPFDDVRVRRAASLALDRRALRRLYGGLLQPTCSFFPLGITGYEPNCPREGADASAGRVRRARRLLDEAHASGASVFVWGDDVEPDRSVTEYMADALSRVGLRARPRLVAGSVYYKTVGNASTHAQAGIANWFPDFPHPANFAVTVSGATRQPTNSPNYGQVHDQEIDRLIERAGRIDDLAASEAIYQRIDELLRRRAYVAAYGSRRLLKIASRRIDFAALRASSVYGLDLTSLRLR